VSFEAQQPSGTEIEAVLELPTSSDPEKEGKSTYTMQEGIPLAVWWSLAGPRVNYHTDTLSVASSLPIPIPSYHL
jgi:hypothetical protein